MTINRNNILADPKDNLMEKVLERDNLKKALERVEKNKGAPGIDGMNTDQLRGHLKDNFARIKEELLSGTYKPMPVRRVEIPKPDGGIRLLGIPTVLDRFIQQAILQALTPIFEPKFANYSYGFRPGKSARQAVYKAQGYIQSGKGIVIDIDLEKFFDRVNHDILMTKVMQSIKDRRMHKVIRRYLKAGIMINGCCIASEEGTPQGGPLSPLLANIMLNDLDHELERRGHTYVRYADDCNIYVKSLRAGQRVYASIKQFIENKLKLKINEAKSTVDRAWKRKFLGFMYRPGTLAQLRLAPKTIQKFKERVRKLTKRNLGISLKKRLESLNQYLLGWSGYYRIIQAKTILENLDGWIRRRLRACLLKQWKRRRTKRRKLMELGIDSAQAKYIAFSRKMYWRLARTQQLNRALGVKYWREQGLLSLVGLSKGYD